MKRYLPFTIIVVVLVAALAAALILKQRGSDGGNSNLAVANSNQPVPPGYTTNAPSQSPASSDNVAKPSAKVGSPVVIEEYGDYQCPPCGALYPELKKIEHEYGDRVRVVFRHLPLTKMHKNALSAARAAEAARLQNRFWEMHDRLYRNQNAWAEDADPIPKFVAYARELGLNVAQFQSDMNSNRVEQVIVADVRKAQSRGIDGTPTLLIEGQQLPAKSTTLEGIRSGINYMLERKAGS